MLYKYTGNRSASNSTVAIGYDIDENGNSTKSVGLNGIADLSNDEYIALSDLFILEPVEDKKENTGKNRPKVVKENENTVAPAADGS